MSSITIVNKEVVSFNGCPEGAVRVGADVPITLRAALRLHNTNAQSLDVTVTLAVRRSPADPPEIGPGNPLTLDAGQMTDRMQFQLSSVGQYAKAGPVSLEGWCEVAWQEPGGEKLTLQRGDVCSFFVTA